MRKFSRILMLLLILLAIAALSILIDAVHKKRSANSIDLPETSVTTIETTPATEEFLPLEEDTTAPVISVYETVPVEGSPDPMQVFDLPMGAYDYAPCRQCFESDQPFPADGTIPMDILMEFYFGEFEKEVTLSENALYGVSGGQSLEIQIPENFFTWSPFNDAVQLGFCNMDTMKCYVYETLPGTHLDCYQETYVYPNLPDGDYRFCVRNLHEKQLNHGYIRFTVSTK